MATVKLRIKVEFIVKPDGESFHAYCPALKGLHVDGATVEEALENAETAADLYLQSLIEHGEPLPLGVVATVTRPNGEPASEASQHIKTLELSSPAAR